MLISTAHAQAAASSSAGGGYEQILMMVAMFAVLYFVMVRPQMKRAKEHKSLVEALSKGDEVVTQGGMAGRIVKVGENYVTLEVAEFKDSPVEVQIQKQAIGNLLPKGTLKTL